MKTLSKIVLSATLISALSFGATGCTLNAPSKEVQKTKVAEVAKEATAEQKIVADAYSATMFEVFAVNTNDYAEVAAKISALSTEIQKPDTLNDDGTVPEKFQNESRDLIVELYGKDLLTKLSIDKTGYYSTLVSLVWNNDMNIAPEVENKKIVSVKVDAPQIDINDGTAYIPTSSITYFGDENKKLDALEHWSPEIKMVKVDEKWLLHLVQ